MTVRIMAGAALALMLAACGQAENPPAAAGTTAMPETASPDALVGTVWTQDQSESGLPGAMQLFLADGTLVSDSCWETYRLSEWRRDGDEGVVWTEDGEEIAAKIVSLTAGELVLDLQLRGGPERKTYKAASAPYVCPDMPR